MSPSARRELSIAALLCLAGAALAVTAGGRPWATVHVTGTLAPLTASVTGQDLSGVATALGWAGLAGTAALFAVRGRIRPVLGVLLVVFGGGVAYASATAVTHERVVSAAAGKSQLVRLGGHVAVSASAWPAVSVAGGVLLVLAGLLTALRGARWPGMSQKYDRATGPVSAGAAVPGAAPDPSALSLWKSLDRGEDPTAEASADPAEDPATR